MRIELRKLTIRDVCAGYKNDTFTGQVSAHHGQLDIRPAYQREFVYTDSKRDAVIDTVLKGFPLNVMYWVVNGSKHYEVLDGQQRTISICEYVAGNFSFNSMQFSSLPVDIQEAFYEYELYIYFCTGEASEKLDWFKTINIAGEKLLDQELRNAIYAGTWLTDAKNMFSRPNCPAIIEFGNYMKGKPLRQEYLETVLKWISENKIEQYMDKHSKDLYATELWEYFMNVASWTKLVFPVYRKEMKGFPWGEYYNKYGDVQYNAISFEECISDLMADDEVGSKQGIYAFMLTGNPKHLNLRAFSDKDKRTMYTRQNGVCPVCEGTFVYEKMHGHHVIPWSLGGITTLSNGQMLCAPCNIKLSNK